MPFPDIKDVGVVARFERWGYPWHGLATNGVLDTSSHPITQPIGGDTYRQRFPDVMPLALPPAQVAADAAMGMTWLDYLILSGNQQQIYGSINLGPRGWIYAGADGTRWWVRLTSSGTLSGNSATFVFSVKKFGEFNATPQTYTRTVPLADLGQSTPAITFESFTEVGPGGRSCTVNSYDVDLDDVRDDGSQAVFGLRSTCHAGLLNWTPQWLAGEPVPVGFLLVDISDGIDGPDIVVSVLFDRASTLGSFTGTAFPDDWIVPGRKIAVWFNDAGLPLPVTLEIDLPHDEDADYLPSLPTPWTWSGSASANMTGSISLSWDAVSASVVVNHTDSRSVTCSRANDMVPTECTITSSVSSYDIAGLVSASRSSPPYDPGIPVSAVARVGVPYMSTGGRFWMDNLDNKPGNSYMWGTIFELPLETPSDVISGETVMIAIKRLSNKYFALLAMKFPYGTDLRPGYPADLAAAFVQTNDMTMLLGFSPAGEDVANAGHLGVIASPTPRVTVHPQLGTVQINVAGHAICWV